MRDKNKRLLVARVIIVCDTGAVIAQKRWTLNRNCGVSDTRVREEPSRKGWVTCGPFDVFTRYFNNNLSCWLL